MAMAVTKFPFLTVAHAMALRKTPGVKMVGVKITGVASLAVINNAAIIAAVKTVVATKAEAVKAVAARLASATNAAGLLWLAANPESMESARATTAQSQRALVGIRML